MASVDLFEDESDDWLRRQFQQDQPSPEPAPDIVQGPTLQQRPVDDPGPGGPGIGPGTTVPPPNNNNGGTNTGGGSGRTEEQQRQYDDAVKRFGQGTVDKFLGNNKGDYGRINTALTNNTSDRPFDSQGPFYDQKTNSLNAAGLAELAKKQNPGMVFETGPGLRPPLTGAGRDVYGFNAPGEQFGNDPYSSFLENIAKQQLDALAQPQSNPQLDRLLSFLDQRFTNLSEHPGYSPEELALLHTQAFEPVEANRQASQKRALERTAARGMLPSSGLLEDEARQIDTEFDKTRAALDRDLGVNAIGKRNQDLAQAQAIAQLMGIQIPQLQRAEDQQRRGEVLNLGNLLYQMPRQAMFDANTIVNGSPAPPDLFNQAVQMLNQQQQQQQMNDQRNAAFWAQLGELFGNLFQ